ncbi:Propanediol utilization protein [Natronincola peptidivorans]|uniref:Phosphate propanoyltransferase n=1 Tax=Natronincola peptidivorans TaxID=426128 RepID=A0A1I0CZ23_9FIRM|nr:phosphate propanoyltransferase [Natronincola peptidivorans]SET25117.1 Propanediol utilization protein [Natronincola peptidivorans]
MGDPMIDHIVERVMQKIMEDVLIPVEVSARHIHLSKEDMQVLFGEEYVMTKKKDLSQLGQCQYQERVTLIGPKGVIEKVAVLGPAREKTQVEISKTDAVKLGINPPVRESGDLKGSGDIFIATDKSVIKAKESVILAKRHIHMTTEDAKKLQVMDKQIVKVKLLTERPIILEDVVVRVSDKYALNLHIDFDEANAALCTSGTLGKMIIE